MSYVVYEKVSTRRIDNINGGPKDKSSFATMAAAKAARTRFLKAQHVYGPEDVLIAESTEFYANIEKDVHGVSAQDGKTPVTVKVNTPYCCDPRFERYWSM
jgi:hypothetical protein